MWGHYLGHAVGGLPAQLSLRLPDDVAQPAAALCLLTLPLDVAGVAHDDVDEGVLDEAAEDEHGAGVHEHVYSLDVGDRGQRLLAVGVLGGEGQQRGHPQRHPGRHRLGLDPEAEHHHYDDHHQYHHHQYHLIQDMMTMRQVGT